MTTSTLRGVLGTWSSTRKLAAAVLLVAVVALAAGALSDRGLSAFASDPVGAKPLAGGARTSATSGNVSSVPGDSAAASGSGIQGDPQAAPGAPLPLKANVTNLSGLRSGDEVKVAVTAEKGSAIYGVEMRVCKAGTVIRNDGDMLPTVTGRCAAHPLSSGTSGFLQVPAAPPYQEIVATFKVGVGTDAFPLDDGGTGSVTCDRSHPCLLAIKFQIPNGFGFRTYPLTFA